MDSTETLRLDLLGIATPIRGATLLSLTLRSSEDPLQPLFDSRITKTEEDSCIVLNLRFRLLAIKQQFEQIHLTVEAVIDGNGEESRMRVYRGQISNRSLKKMKSHGGIFDFRLNCLPGRDSETPLVLVVESVWEGPQQSVLIKSKSTSGSQMISQSRCSHSLQYQNLNKNTIDSRASQISRYSKATKPCFMRQSLLRTRSDFFQKPSQPQHYDRVQQNYLKENRMNSYKSTAEFAKSSLTKSQFFGKNNQMTNSVICGQVFDDSKTQKLKDVLSDLRRVKAQLGLARSKCGI